MGNLITGASSGSGHAGAVLFASYRLASGSEHCVAGDDAKAMYAQHLEVGDEVFRAGIDQGFFDP